MSVRVLPGAAADSDLILVIEPDGHSNVLATERLKPHEAVALAVELARYAGDAMALRALTEKS